MQNTANIPMDNLLTILRGMSLNDRRLIARQLEEQMESEEVTDAAALKVLDDEKLDAFLSKVSGNWCDDKTPQELAAELRHEADFVRNVEIW